MVARIWHYRMMSVNQDPRFFWLFTDGHAEKRIAHSFIARLARQAPPRGRGAADYFLAVFHQALPTSEPVWVRLRSCAKR